MENSKASLSKLQKIKRHKWKKFSPIFSEKKTLAAVGHPRLRNGRSGGKMFNYG